MISINTLGFLVAFLIVTIVTVDADVADDNSRIPNLSALACEGSALNIRCSNGQINVISANYGRTSRAPCNEKGNVPIRTVNCVSRNSLAIVDAQCSNKETCSVQATNGVFGEPCEGTLKYLKVEYECVDKNRSKKVVACEHSQLEIECERGEEIRVLEANYGRTTRKVCNKNGNAPILTTNCKSRKSIEIVREKCGGQRKCTVSASNAVFGEPCDGTLKYLEVEYICVRRRN